MSSRPGSSREWNSHRSRREDYEANSKTRDGKGSKHKKRKKKSRSSSDSSSSSSNSSGLLQRLMAKREEQSKKRKQAKELLKATETPEQKRQRRLKKKEEKEKKRKERMGWDKDYLHYTNTDNPFGDANLLSTFVWKKKLDKDGLTNITTEDLEKRNREKQDENRRELEKVKKRRIERELEKQRREEDMALMQRNKEAAQFQEYGRYEDQFHLEQARLRSKIRIQDGRAKPIDLLAKYISAEDEVDAVEMHEPYTYLHNLSSKDLEDLCEDINVYKELEKGKNLDYWNDITTIVEDELSKIKKMERKSEYEAAVDRREGIHQSVSSDVAAVFKGKTAAQLVALQLQIEEKLSQKVDGLDIGYWESLLSQLKAHIAKARLRDRHQLNLQQKLQLLKAQQGVEVKSEPEDEAEEESSQNEEEEAEGSAANPVADILSECLADYEAGSYSPSYVDPGTLEPGTIVCLEADDEQRLTYARVQVAGTGHRSESATAAERQLLQEARKGMTDDEVQFSVETALDPQVYFWSDKYRPRKPRYFNRVHTGFEWNKYNQTHYDMDNPPPKIVQGYKFNIFYPDLIDKTTTPEYFMTPCVDNQEFAVLRFHAGPPYEDIAFKIVNREWEYSYKRGFRCQFHNNIFQLWFHFKRYRYRR